MSEEKITLSKNQVLNLVSAIANGEYSLDENDDQQEQQKGYINKWAVAVMKFADANLNELKYDNGLPVEKAFIDDIQDILGNFNRSNYVTGKKAEKLLDAVINNNDFFKFFSVVYGDELTIPIDLKAYSKRQLISTTRLGRQLTASEKSALASISGFELFLREVELQYDISMYEVRNNLYNPNFEKEVLLDPMLKVIGEDLLDLATNGVSDSYDTVSSDGFLSLGIGYEYLLKNLNGTWTNSNGTTSVVGKFGHYHTPHRYKIDFASDYDGSDICAAMDAMFTKLPLQYRKDAVFILSETDLDLYDYYKTNSTKTIGSTVVGINTETRDNLANYGGHVPHRGRPVIANPKALSISDGGSIVFGILSDIFVGMQRTVNTTREYKARISKGGDGIENTKIMYVDFQVGRRNAFVIGAASLSVEDPVMIKSIVGGTTVYGDRAYNKGDVYTSAETDQSSVSAVTVYCDTPKARIFKHVNTSGFDDGTDLPADALPTIAGDVTEVTAGDLVTLTTGQYATFRAYQVEHDGTLSLTPSSLVKIRYTAA